jgi:2-iminobutanoate/2-iminopropanoate deaminase
MPREIVFTDQAARPPAVYSQAVKAAGLVFVSGTAPRDAATGDIVGETIQEQTRQCLRNIEAILEAAGSSMDKIVNVTFVLAEDDDFAGMNEEYARWFPSNPPARSGAKFPTRVPGQKISIAAIAAA